MPVAIIMRNEEKSGSFVVVSDFYSNQWPLDKIESYYLNEYEYIFILGDATDRGESKQSAGGINLLIKIMELTKKYPNRIFYVPGNHDQFLYEYMSERDEFSRNMLLRNGGQQIIADIDNLKQTDPNKFIELMEWLGSCPLQRKHEYQGKRYVMAHALFTEYLWKVNPDYSLNHYINESECNIKDVARRTLWFRKNKDIYWQNELPDYDCTMVIGHTPPHSREGLDLSLINRHGDKISVICVDGGITFNHRKDSGMKYSTEKYVGGDGGAVYTFKGGHHTSTKSDGSPRHYSFKGKTVDEPYEYDILDSYIVKRTLEYIESGKMPLSDIKSAVKSDVLKGFWGEKPDGVPFLKKRFIKSDLCRQMIFNELDTRKIEISNSYVNDRFANQNIDYIIAYIDIVLTNHIIKAFLERRGLDSAASCISSYICGGYNQKHEYVPPGAPNWITRNQSARALAKVITPNEFQSVLRNWGEPLSSVNKETIKAYIECYLSDFLKKNPTYH